ncbi:hypothetical protein MMC14_004755 [Varicellaria rhodocarpa]|nr:hypothetical protein [Varicellaria rhodocarpa]
MPRAIRHDWTDEELETLCCLATQGMATPEEIAGFLNLTPSQVRYRIRFLNGKLGPANQARVPGGYRGMSDLWQRWERETGQSLATQRILRPFGVRSWPTQEMDDCLLILKLFGHREGTPALSDKDVHAQMAQSFGASWTKTLADVAGWQDTLDVGEGSYGWVMERYRTGEWGSIEPLMHGWLQRCGLWVGYDLVTGAVGFDLRP